MRLLPIEEDRLLVFMAAELARRRKERGLRLSCPEAVALIADETHEAARSGASYEQVVAVAQSALTAADVMDGVVALVPSVRVECLFNDGMRLVMVTNPIRPAPLAASQETGAVTPGQRILEREDVELHARSARVDCDVVNESNDVIWVGSHYPFFEVNRRLRFDRAVAWGKHLDVPAGDAVQFLPRSTTRVALVDYDGQKVIRGFNGLTDGEASPARLHEAVERCKANGF